MTVAAPIRDDVSLEDRYRAESGAVLLSGIQALVRLILDIRRADRSHGLDTGAYVSGYEGSPLGGLDQELARAHTYLDSDGVVFQPGLNEELAATAVGGTQLLATVSGPLKQGVTGFWYGKNPGFDRATDAVRHANFSGTAPLGGAVAFVGDDPTAKSSTVPSSCEPACRSLILPVLSPGTVQEVLALGLHAVALSRHSGLWSAMRIVTELADSCGEACVGTDYDALCAFEPRAGHAPPVLLPPANLAAERELLSDRLARVVEYERFARLNRVLHEPPRPRFAIVASGFAHQAVLRALELVGLDDGALDQIGIRLIQISMPWPLDAAEVRHLLADIETVLVIEDKLPFVETQLKEALYREPHAPMIIGKQDRDGWPLLPVSGAIGADEVVTALARLIPDELLGSELHGRFAAATAEVQAPAGVQFDDSKRTPYFCSGCPHNTSTRADADSLVGVGIGCHTMVAIDSEDRRGQHFGPPQMGGEGGLWIGLSPFTSTRHFIQNMGDGTFHHSGSLSIRAAVAAGVNITFRLLYNDAVAMTGGQQPQGQLAIPELVTELAAEGVKRVVITTPEPARYRHVKLDPIATVSHRDQLQAIQAELESVAGVTVLLHDDRCATEKRRLRKRGSLPVPAERPFINERVCEGCGDCGDVSSCLSVQPVQSEFGRKTRIHQSSCNQDMSCLKGDCPSFLLVKPGPEGRPDAKHEAPSAPPIGLPEPVVIVDDDVMIRMPGVGGTGVVTAAAILRMAAFLSGHHTAGLDQTGLAQKGGPVVSDLRVSARPVLGQLRATRRSVDLLLGFDLLGCVDPNTLGALAPGHTVAIVNSDLTPTAASVLDPAAGLPRTARLIGHVRQGANPDRVFAVPATRLSERLFADHMQANLLLVGAAYQHGFLPIEADAIERAIELNGTAVGENVAAFRWGRAVVAQPDLLRSPELLGAEAGSGVALTAAELIDRRSGELRAYQSAGYARRYRQAVTVVADAERACLGSGHDEVTRAYAEGLFKLMAYKDEYEVARLHLDPVERARVEAEFGPGAEVKVLLHPPVLRALGMRRKLAFGRSAKPLFRTLRAMRRLRGTRLDLFGLSEVRRCERVLPAEYTGLVMTALDRLDPTTVATVLSVAELPDLVRGYERIKLDNIARMRARADELLASLDSPSDGGGGFGSAPVEEGIYVDQIDPRARAEHHGIGR